MTDTQNTITIFKSRTNLLEIMETRGFPVNDYSGFSPSEVHAMASNKQLDMLLTHQNGKKIYIKYNINKALRPDNVYNIVDDLFNIENILSKNDDLIIIIKEEPNDTLIKLQTHIWNTDGIYLAIINISRLQFNILKHDYVPPHTPLNKEEADIVKKTYNILNDKQLPDISRFSPVSLVLGLRPGDMCRIDRPSKTAISAPFYRICS